MLSMSALALLHVKPNTNYCVGLAYGLGRVASLTLFANLMTRQRPASRSGTAATISTQNGSRSFKMSKLLSSARRASSGFDIQGSGIQALQPAHIFVEVSNHRRADERAS